MSKTEIATMNLTKLFNTGGLDKSYLCLVEGLVNDDKGQVSHLLIKNGNKAYLNDRGKQCDLSWSVKKRLDRYTFLDVEIKQGRFHQIRCQLSQIGFPIKGDLKYGSKRSNKEAGIYLCCHKLSFEHPFSGEVIDLNLDLGEFSLPLWKLAE
jgi:23S rRNA pseudouridine1911/1915/1917 synthase